MLGCPESQSSFFTEFVPYIRPMAKRLGIDENYLLALTALEDSWGHDAHNVKLHNIFGITHGGGNNIAFPSYQACCDYWERHYGNTVRNAKNLDEFCARMRLIGYNTVNSKYYQTYRATYASVVKYKNACKVQ